MTVCSVEAALVGERLAGTAPLARAWIVIEHPGPWGREAVAESDLPEAVRLNLASAKDVGVSVLLARRPDRPGREWSGATNVWVARSASGGMLMRHGTLTDLAGLAQWDLAAIATGSLPAFGEVIRDPLLLVCTHSRRDRCCAVNGRALVTAILAAATPAQAARVWECSHIGGHRFAPVTLSLPSGTVHGRMDDAGAILSAVEDGRVLIPHLRGRSSHAPALQAAEAAVRAATGIDGDDDLDVLRVVGERVVPSSLAATFEDDETAEVRHRDGRAWRVTVHQRDLARPRPESCGKEALLGRAWHADAPVATTPWT